MPSSQDAVSGAAVEHFEDLMSHAKSYKKLLHAFVENRKEDESFFFNKEGFQGHLRLHRSECSSEGVCWPITVTNITFSYPTNQQHLPYREETIGFDLGVKTS